MELRNLLRGAGWLLLLLLLVGGISLAMWARPTLVQPEQPSLQAEVPLEEFPHYLYHRLVTIDVPVREVRIANQAPLSVEILLERTGQGGVQDPDEIWYEHLSVREAALSYLNGPRVESVRVGWIDPEGVVTFAQPVSFAPDAPGQNLAPLSPSSLDENIIQQLITSRIDLHDMQLDSITVTTGGLVRENARLVMLEISMTDRMHYYIPAIGQFLEQFYWLEETFPEAGAAQIALVRVILRSAYGSRLGDFIRDLELSGMTGWGYMPLWITPRNPGGLRPIVTPCFEGQYFLPYGYPGPNETPPPCSYQPTFEPYPFTIIETPVPTLEYPSPSAMPPETETPTPLPYPMPEPTEIEITPTLPLETETASPTPWPTPLPPETETPTTTQEAVTSTPIPTEPIHPLDTDTPTATLEVDTPTPTPIDTPQPTAFELTPALTPSGD
jgi:hypothetical protein